MGDELPGMRYGMKFPFTPEMLQSSKYGAKWLTEAFRACGSMGKDNKVVSISNVKPLVGGGACLKNIFDVKYEKADPSLHTKLFMKYPFRLDKNMSNRMSSAVMLQPADLAEVDCCRYFEAAMPFPIPKLYFGDISNKSTNFILITECINYGDSKKKAFAPFEIEPAYEKFLDDEQFENNGLEYYQVLIESNAALAGYYHAGKLGDIKKLDTLIMDASAGTPAPLNPAEFKTKIKMAEDWVRLAANLFPLGMITDSNMVKWRKILDMAASRVESVGDDHS